MHYGLDDSFDYTPEERLKYVRLYDKGQPPPPPDPLGKYSDDEWLRISRNMEDYGGSFCQHLARMMVVADLHNRRCIVQVFEQYLDKFASPIWGGGWKRP